MKKKEVWAKRVTSVVKSYEYDDKGNLIKETQTVIETQTNDDQEEKLTSGEAQERACIVS